MPGLLRGVARTAVIAGTATAVSNRVSRRQANRWAAAGASRSSSTPQPQYAAPPPAPEPAAEDPDRAADASSPSCATTGILTEEEFAAEKHKILG